MRLYFPVDLTGNLIMIEKLVLGETEIWTGDLPISNPNIFSTHCSGRTSPGTDTERVGSKGCSRCKFLAGTRAVSSRIERHPRNLKQSVIYNCRLWSYEKLPPQSQIGWDLFSRQWTDLGYFIL